MADANALTEREQRIMAFAWQCIDDQPKVNFAKLARLAGMTNQGSASNAWARIKKKLHAQAQGAVDADPGIGAGTGQPSTPSSRPRATPRRRARKASDEEETPARQKRKVVRDSAYGDDEEEHVVVKQEPGEEMEGSADADQDGGESD